MVDKIVKRTWTVDKIAALSHDVANCRPMYCGVWILGGAFCILLGLIAKCKCNKLSENGYMEVSMLIIIVHSCEQQLRMHTPCRQTTLIILTIRLHCRLQFCLSLNTPTFTMYSMQMWPTRDSNHCFLSGGST